MFEMEKQNQPIVVVHGGAGDITTSKLILKIEGLKAAAVAGYKAVTDANPTKVETRPAVLGAIEAVAVMEDLESFNCGYGSVLTSEGRVEMDASVMDGNDLNFGAVACIDNVQHPIKVALEVMKSRHTMLGGRGANEFAIVKGFPEVENSTLVTEWAIKAQERLKNSDQTGTNELGEEDEDNNDAGGVGTVGAVVMDQLGNLAAATSTGGMTNQMCGRIGDTPIIGAGTYADKQTAISTTGAGESLMKVLSAKRMSDLIQGGMCSADDAIKIVLDFMKQRVGGDGGAIALTSNQEVGINWNSERMAWAYIKDDKLHYGGRFRGDHVTEDLQTYLKE